MIGKMYCLCGAKLEIRHNFYAEARDIMDGFWLAHQGDGHEEITKGQAMQAELKREKAVFAGQVERAARG